MIAFAMATAAAILCHATQDAPDSPFDQVQALVERAFYDPGAVGGRWRSLCDEYRQRFDDASSPPERSAVINELLDRLGASHTEHLGPWQQRFHHLNSIFGEPLTYPGVGIETAEIGGKVFVRWVYDGSDAQRAGIHVGDEIVAVDGEPYRGVDSFRGNVGEQTLLELRRERGGDVINVPCNVSTLDGRAMFLDAMKSSVRIVAHGDASVGFVHVWSYAGAAVQEALESIVLHEPIADADALVLDLRGGLGGAQPEYLSLFNRHLPVMAFRPRDGEWREVASHWTKPIVLLVDETSSSGKEIFAHGFRKLKLGPIVGGRTAGAVVAGRLFQLTDGTTLYLAVADVRVDGERLEGVGVAPDIEVPFELPYANGADPRLEKALEVAAAHVAASRAGEAQPIP